MEWYQIALMIFMAPYVLSIILGVFLLIWEALNWPTMVEWSDDDDY